MSETSWRDVKKDHYYQVATQLQAEVERQQDVIAGLHERLTDLTSRLEQLFVTVDNLVHEVRRRGGKHVDAVSRQARGDEGPGASPPGVGGGSGGVQDPVGADRVGGLGGRVVEER